MSVKHSDLTGSELHECKGTDVASANTVKIANGAGSAVWSKITLDNINQASIKNINKTSLFINCSTPDSLYIPVEQTKILTNVAGVLNSTITGGQVDIILKKNGTTIGTTSIVNSTPQGTSFSVAVSGTTFLTSDTIKVEFSGAGSGSFSFVLSFSL